MAITNIPIMGIGNGTGSSQSEAKNEAVNEVIEGIFANVNAMLSPHFTRVSANTTKFDGKTQYHYRESYKFNGNDSKYLIVEFSVPTQFPGGGYETINLNFSITNQMATTSTSSISFIASIGTTSKATYTQTTVDSIVTFDVTISLFCMTFENENMFLLSGGNNKQNLYQSLGIITVNGENYIMFTNGSNNAVFSLFDKNGVKYFTNSTIIAGHSGTDDSNYIMTLPIYLSSGNTVTSQIFKDLKVENVLQCPNSACSYGGIYKIGGVDYFAIGNNFLLKM